MFLWCSRVSDLVKCIFSTKLPFTSCINVKCNGVFGCDLWGVTVHHKYSTWQSSVIWQIGQILLQNDVSMDFIYIL